MRFYQTAAITNAILAVAAGDPWQRMIFGVLACLCLFGVNDREKKAEQRERARVEQWIRH